MQRISRLLLLVLSFICFQIITPPLLYSAKEAQNHPQSNADVKIPPKLKTELNSQLQKLVGSQDAAVLALPQGEPILFRHCQKALIPASTLKILTALVAIENLGDKYRFATDFYLDSSKNLKIKGYGDPLLISESLAQIAQRLARQISNIQDIVIDDGYFRSSVKIPGKNNSLQPYDAPNGAFCVNFNTVAFKTVRGAFVSAEKQTPLLPFSLAKAKASGLKEGRIMLAGDPKESIRYAGELLQYFLTQAGIKISGEIKQGSIDPAGDKLILHYLSQFTLDHVISRLMEFSNNFIANQLFLSSGAVGMGPPATLAKGKQIADRYIERQLGLKEITIVEGSGLSRRNRISARAMIMLLKRFEPYYQLLRHEGREYYKTGTLSNVKSRAGYLEDAHGRRYPFVVIMNTPGKTTTPAMQLFKKAIRKISA